MKKLKTYLIELFKLGNGLHEFTYDIDKKFFDQFEDSLVEKGNLKVVVQMEKTDNVSTLKFKIEGKVELTCDKSLDLFYYPITLEQKLILKYGEEFDDSDDTIIIIDRNQPEINIAPYFYEFITLEIPFRKLHPRYQEEEAEEDNLIEELGLDLSNEVDQLIYATLVPEEEEIEEQDEEEKKEIDPRWAALEQLKKK